MGRRFFPFSQFLPHRTLVQMALFTNPSTIFSIYFVPPSSHSLTISRFISYDLEIFLYFSIPSDHANYKQPLFTDFSNRGKALILRWEEISVIDHSNTVRGRFPSKLYPAVDWCQD